LGFLKLTGFRSDSQVFGPPLDFQAREWQDEWGQVVADKMARHSDGTLTISLEAGVGAGKTVGVAWVASHILNAKLASRIVYVGPNRSILADAIATFRQFGIHLVNWENGKFPYGEPIDTNGLAMTYASLNKNADLQRKLYRHSPTLLCLDEFHHLGDQYAWCGAARDAFEGHVKVVIPFSGTPWRTDRRELPFMTTAGQEGDVLLYAMDYSY
jgi:superfamily II DNA or RNA helicase